jgi:hypothetical protein
VPEVVHRGVLRYPRLGAGRLQGRIRTLDRTRPDLRPGPPPNRVRALREEDQPGRTPLRLLRIRAVLHPQPASRELGEVRGEGVHSRLCERHRPVALVCLRFADIGDALVGADELLGDTHRAAQEVDVLDLDPEHLALPQARRCGEQHRGPVPVGELGHQSVDRSRLQRDEVGLPVVGQHDLVARRRTQRPVEHSRPEHGTQHVVRRAQASRLERPGPVLDPRLDLRPLDARYRAVTECRVDVQPERPLHLRHRRVPVNGRRPPALGNRPEGLLGRLRIHVLATGEVGLNGGRAGVGLSALSEGLLALLAVQRPHRDAIGAAGRKPQPLSATSPPAICRLSTAAGAGRIRASHVSVADRA